MESMYKASIQTPYGEKTIEVFSCNILDFDKEMDILTTSAFCRSYSPMPKTMFAALESVGISIEMLARNPEMDLRKNCNIWLSEKLIDSKLPVGRIGCVELMQHYNGENPWREQEHNILTAIKAYFQMLDIAGTAGVKMDTVALPLLGAGRQRIASDMVLIPMVNECVEFLKRNPFVKQLYFIDYNPKNAFQLAMTLEKLYSFKKEYIERKEEQKSLSQGEKKVFISYSSGDRAIADSLCKKLEQNGVSVWYAPRDISENDYASAIVRAISVCTHFVTIISQNSMMSEHVLNEIDLAFKELRRNIRFLPLRMDEEELRPAFSYYLSRQHWTDAHIPPVEYRLDEFVRKIAEE